MSRDKKIEELTAELIKTNSYGTLNAVAEALYNAGYRKQIEGEWEKRTFIIFDSEKVGYTCSECNTTWDTETKFCPNCGARMKGENK